MCFGDGCWLLRCSCFVLVNHQSSIYFGCYLNTNLNLFLNLFSQVSVVCCTVLLFFIFPSWIEIALCRCRVIMFRNKNTTTTNSIEFNMSFVALFFSFSHNNFASCNIYDDSSKAILNHSSCLCIHLDFWFSHTVVNVRVQFFFFSLLVLLYETYDILTYWNAYQS